MLSALIFYSFLFVALVVAPALSILAVLLFLDHGRQFWQRAGLVIEFTGAAIAQAPGVPGLRKRFPRTAGFLERRLDTQDPWGLRATGAGIGILVGLWFFLGVWQDVAARDPLAILDIRLHNAVPLFRSSGVTGLMVALTALGSATVLSLVSSGVALLALARNRSRLAATFVLAVVGTGIVSGTLKMLFGYARPIDGMVPALEASFPSGHMLSGTVVYGLLAALLLRSPLRRGLRVLGVTLLLLVIVGIGLSRLYLGVHWPSDILGSLALALIILASLIFFQHYSPPIRWIDTFRLPLSPRAASISGCAILIVALGAATVLGARTQIVAKDRSPATRPLDIATLRSALPPDISRWSEDLVGGRMEPISLVIVGSEKDLLSAFTLAGWTRADLPTPLRLVEEGLAALADRADPAGPATPAFLADRPQDITFERPDAGIPSIRRRHHARVWRTDYCLAPACRTVWVATASHDVGMGLSKTFHVPTHHIDPALDAERAIIVGDLTRVGAIQEGSVTVSAPVRGMNAAGDRFRTDGRAVVLVFPSRLDERRN